MNIAVYHNLPSGGGKRALYEMTKRLVERHVVDVYTLSTAEHDFCDLRPLVRKHFVFPFQSLPLSRPPFGRLNQGIRTLDLLRLEAVQRRVATQIDSAGYDVVFVHNCSFSQSPGLLKFVQTPSVYYCQEPPRKLYEPVADRPYAAFSRMQRLGNLVDPLPVLYRQSLATLDRKNVQAAQLILVNSAYSRESLYRVYGVNARVCHLGVDSTRFHPMALPKEPFVLSVGALIATKGFDFLIRSLARIAHKARPCLILVSNHTNQWELKYLEELAMQMEVDVKFMRMLSEPELIAAYNRAALTAYAPVMEPFGFVPIESMACATPVVAVCEAGVRESVITDVTGVLTQRNVNEFAAALERVLVQREWAKDLGQNGLHHVRQNWTWNATLVQVETAFQMVLSGANEL